MAYAYLDENGLHQPIRLIVEDTGPGYLLNGKVRVCDPLPAGTEWVCDPCNSSNERYEVRFSATQVGYYPWYRVVTHDDGPDEIRVKVEHFEKVIAARIAVEKAKREYEKVV